jgi:DNA-binding CsgD family transcriptional regulator
MTDALIDLIYEAGVNSDLWPTVLDQMSMIAGAEGGVLFAAGTGSPQWTSSISMRSHMQAFVEEGWAARNTRGEAAFRQRLSSFATDHDTLPVEEIENSPLYREFFRPRGLGWSIGTSIVPLTGDVLVVSLERAYAKGPVEESVKTVLDPMRPHLARAGVVAARLGLERARGMVMGLDMIGLAAAVVTATGVVVASNNKLAELTDFVGIRAFDRITLNDPMAHRSLLVALEALNGRDGRQRPPMSFPLSGINGTAPAVAHLVPLIASARDIFQKGDALFIASRVGQGGVPDASLLEAIFDLTPAEARIARQLVEGKTSINIAQQATVSHETVRTHMKAIFRKTGVSRQVDLVRLVSGLPKVA